MTTRIGCVLVFKKGTNIAEAAAALEKIQDVLDLPETTTEYIPVAPRFKASKKVTRPFQMSDKIHDFDEKDFEGGPAGYIP